MQYGVKLHIFYGRSWLYQLINKVHTHATPKTTCDATNVVAQCRTAVYDISILFKRMAWQQLNKYIDVASSVRIDAKLQNYSWQIPQNLPGICHLHGSIGEWTNRHVTQPLLKWFNCKTHWSCRLSLIFTIVRCPNSVTTKSNDGNSK